jgi:hypothetical protein
VSLEIVNEPKKYVKNGSLACAVYQQERGMILRIELFEQQLYLSI